MLSLVENLFLRKSFTRFALQLNAVISTNESDEFITGHVIYIPAYTNKFQLKTTQDKLTIRLEQVSSRIDWSTTSRLIFGSLVLLFSPAGNSFTFWTVQEKTFQSRTLELTLISANPTQLLQGNFYTSQNVTIMCSNDKLSWLFT